MIILLQWVTAGRIELVPQIFCDVSGNRALDHLPECNGPKYQLHLKYRSAIGATEGLSQVSFYHPYVCS
jgi:hypothetical protein